MKLCFVVTDELRELIRHLPPQTKKKIRNALDEILENPNCGKALRDELSGLMSYKLDTIRIIYQIDQTFVALIAIGPRKTIYQRVALEIKRLKDVRPY